jgi:hypothetical protein
MEDAGIVKRDVRLSALVSIRMYLYPILLFPTNIMTVVLPVVLMVMVSVLNLPLHLIIRNPEFRLMRTGSSGPALHAPKLLIETSVAMGPYQGGQAQYLRVPYADFNCLPLPAGTEHGKPIHLPLFSSAHVHPKPLKSTSLTTPQKQTSSSSPTYSPPAGTA